MTDKEKWRERCKSELGRNGTQNEGEREIRGRRKRKRQLTERKREGKRKKEAGRKKQPTSRQRQKQQTERKMSTGSEGF